MELAEINDDIEAFLIESYENLNQIESDIIALEKLPPDGEVAARMYRSLHTLKGNCGFLPFPILESLAHAGESLLSAVRDRRLAVTPAIVTGLLQTVDAIRQILAGIEATRQEGTEDYAALLRRLTELQNLDLQFSGLQSSDVRHPSLMASQAVVAAPSSRDQHHSLDQPASSSLEPGTSPWAPVTNGLSDSVTLVASDSSVRVNVGLLDQVMNLVGELVLIRNQVIGFSTTFKDAAFASACQRLNQTTTELQEGIMRTRLQPISTLWQKFPRVTRDLAIATGKQVEVEMEGAETELDKSMIEAIKDPLTHLVRNCMDHGIEPPAERLAQGKPSAGRLTLRALHKGGNVMIEIGDDGRGLNPEQLKQRAQQLGLIHAGQAATMSDLEAMQLIFLPGFSTSEQITNLSGRGLGMDIVKSTIERINGSIEIQSQPGQGTRFKIKIPLTLAIIPALIVGSGGERFAIPQAALQELVRLEAAQAQAAISTLYDVPVYRLRGNLVPLVYLNRILQLQDSSAEADMLSLVIIQTDEYQFGLVVDQIDDVQDIVVKPLGSQLKALSLFAGATILGNGKAALIIDVLGLANRAGVTAQLQQRLAISAAASSLVSDDDRPLILLVQGPENARMGIPATLAVRLEEMPLTAVEKVNTQYVIRYRDAILPLIDLQTQFSTSRQTRLDEPMVDVSADAVLLSIVVVSPRPGCSVGFVVDRILDIVEAPLTLTGIASRPGIRCNAVIHDQITEILDVEAVIRAANPYLLQGAAHG